MLNRFGSGVSSRRIDGFPSFTMADITYTGFNYSAGDHRNEFHSPFQQGPSSDLRALEVGDLGVTVDQTKGDNMVSKVPG